MDPDIEYTVGEYNEMFSFSDENKQQKRERNMEVISDFMRENQISSSILQGKNLNELNDKALRHIAVSVGIGEDSVSRFQGAGDILDIMKNEGITDKILDLESVKGTMIGKALKQIDKESYEKNGNFTNIGEKIYNIFEAMTVPVKIMAGISDISDIKRTYKGLDATRSITKGIYNTITATKTKEEKTETETETEETKIIEKLNDIQKERTNVRNDSGLSYPSSQKINPYRFPNPDENWSGVGLIKDSVTSYLNDKNLYGGSYTDIFYNEI